MALGAEADRSPGPFAHQIDGQGDAVVDIGLARRDQGLAGVQFADQVVRMGRLAAAEPDLRQPRAGAHQDGERARADLGVERAAIAALDLVELARAVGDHPGEHVQPAGRAFRVGRRRGVGAERKFLQERHDVDATGLEHGAGGEIELVQGEPLEPFGDAELRPGQKARAHPVGGAAEPEIEACGLDLTVDEGLRRSERSGVDQGLDFVRRQNARPTFGSVSRSGFSC